MTVVSRQMLREAKGFIQRKGWAQGDEDAIHGCGKKGYCVATACNAAATRMRLPDIVGAGRDMVLLFRDANGIPQDIPISLWNDAPERTKDEVLAAFDTAIAAASEGGWEERDRRYDIERERKQRPMRRRPQ